MVEIGFERKVELRLAMNQKLLCRPVIDFQDGVRNEEGKRHQMLRKARFKTCSIPHARVVIHYKPS